MTQDQANSIWEEMVTKMRAGEVMFHSWQDVRANIPYGTKEFVNSLIKGLTQGTIDFYANAPTQEFIILVPKSKINGVDFLVVYKTESGYDYFGISKSEGLKRLSIRDVRLRFADAMV